MAIAGAVVVPSGKESEQKLVERLKQLPTVEVQEIGPKGIAVVLDEKDTDSLRALSEKIKSWQEVVDLQVAYINWEDTAESGQDA